MSVLRIATYNVHKGQGIDGRLSPGRVAEVIAETGAEVVALQEVVSHENGAPEEHQASFIARALGFDYVIGENRRLGEALYGNVVMSRHPLTCVRNHDITVRGRERRGCLHTDVDVPGVGNVHVFNVHLGTSYLERRHQGRRLVEPEILANITLGGRRVVLGDFNEWAPGLASKLLRDHLQSVDIRKHLQRSFTYPGIFPFMHLDHIYFEDTLSLQALRLHRTRLALMASDHLPLVAEFTCAEASAAAGA